MIFDHVLKTVAVSVEQVQVEFHEIGVCRLFLLKQVYAQVEIFVRGIDFVANHVGDGQIVEGDGFEHVDVTWVVPFELVHEILTCKASRKTVK